MIDQGSQKSIIYKSQISTDWKTGITNQKPWQWIYRKITQHSYFEFDQFITQDQLQIIVHTLFYQLVIQTCQDYYKRSHKLIFLIIWTKNNAM